MVGKNDFNLERTPIKRDNSKPSLIHSLKPQQEYRGHILILDDEPANRELLSRHIQQLGMKPFACEKAEQAYEVLQNNDIDLILLDLIMPEVSGHQVLADLKATTLACYTCHSHFRHERPRGSHPVHSSWG